MSSTAHIALRHFELYEDNGGQLTLVIHHQGIAISGLEYLVGASFFEDVRTYGCAWRPQDVMGIDPPHTIAELEEWGFFDGGTDAPELVAEVRRHGPSEEVIYYPGKMGYPAAGYTGHQID